MRMEMFNESGIGYWMDGFGCLRVSGDRPGSPINVVVGYDLTTERIQNPIIYPGVGITSKCNRSNPQPGDPCPTLTDDSRYYLVGKQEVNPDG